MAKKEIVRMLKKGRLIVHILCALVLFSCKLDPQNENKSLSEEIPTPKLSMETFFRNGNKTNIKISHDGQYYSFKADYKGVMNIFVQKLGDTNAIRVTSDSLRNIYSYFWKGNKIVYLQDEGGDENYQAFSVNLDGSDSKTLTAFKGVRTDVIDELTDIKGKEKLIMIGLNKRRSDCIDPYLLNIETGELKLVYNNIENYDSWVTDNEGVIRMASKPFGTKTIWSYRKSEEETLKPFKSVDFENEFIVSAFDKKNTNVFVITNVGRDKKSLIEYNPNSGSEVKVIYSNPNYDIENINFDRKTGQLISVNYTGEKFEQVFLDNKWAKIHYSFHKRFPSHTKIIVGSDSAKQKFIAAIFNDRMPPKYYLYNSITNQLEEVANCFPWIKENNMAHTLPISYMSRDGKKIHGYLTLPKGLKATNLPVIVNPHGGPWNRDEWGYNPEVQFFASRGYAILQMNYRGSTGYGKKFYEAGFKEWGGKIQNDITDGVNWLIKQNIADPKRIAIYGSSFGGNAALFGVTLTPDLYAAGIADVAASNMFTFIRSLAPQWGPYMQQFYQMVGNPNDPKDSLMLHKISPLFHLDNIKVPLFISCGANDPRVNRAESDQMVNALKKKGLFVEYMVKDNEGHGFSNQNNQFEFYRAIEKFLDEHVKNKNTLK